MSPIDASALAFHAWQRSKKSIGIPRRGFFGRESGFSGQVAQVVEILWTPGGSLVLRERRQPDEGHRNVTVGGHEYNLHAPRPGFGKLDPVDVWRSSMNAQVSGEKWLASIRTGGTRARPYCLADRLGP